MKYRAERQFLKLVGATVRTYDESNNLACKAEAKAFKLKEEITFFSDEEKTKSLFSIKARNIFDISATYDIFVNGTKQAALRRKGLASAFVRDEWHILDQNDVQIGLITEDSNMFGIIRRWVDFVALIFPQKFEIRFGDSLVGTMQQNKNPFTVKLACDYDDAKVGNLGSILPVAIPSMLAIIDARQS